jgi:multidrug resistance protein, MATE family
MLAANWMRDRMSVSMTGPDLAQRNNGELALPFQPATGCDALPLAPLDGAAARPYGAGMTPPATLTWRGHARAVLALGLPLVGSHIAQIAIHVTDTVMLGWYGVDALAAGVLGASVFMVLMIVGSGFAWAAMPLAASAVAEGDDAALRRVTRMAFWLSTIFAALVLPPMIWSGALLRALGQEAALAADAQAYLRFAAWGMFPALLAMGLKSYLAALEKTRPILWATILSALFNAVANWALIFGNWGAPELGLQGAAIASVVAHAAAFAGLAGYAAWAPALRRHALFVRLWRPDWPGFAQVFRLGWPIGLTSFAETGLFAASAVMVGWLGAGPLAAHGIALELASITFMVHLGLSQAATVRAGQALGRGDGPGLRRGAAVVAAVSAVFALATVVLFLTAPGFLIGLFLDPADPAAPAIVGLGVTLLAVAALFQMADAAQVMALGLLRGLRDTRVPMVLAALSYWAVGLPAGYLLGFVAGHGAPGVWFGLVIGLSLAALSLSARFLVMLRRVAPAAAAGSS